MNRGEGRGTRDKRGHGWGATPTALRGHVVGSIHAILVAALFAAILAAAAAHAAEPAAAPLATIDRIQIGFAGHYKVGFWTPVEITLTGGPKAITADLEIVVPDGDGVPTRTVEHGVQLEPSKANRVRGYVKFGRPTSTVTITVNSPEDSARPVERTFSGDDVPPALGATQRLILELGGPLEFGSVTRFNEEGQPEQATVAAVDDPKSLPDRWFGYDCVDIAVLTTGEADFYNRIPAASLAALRRWVQLGGRLLLSVGGHGPELLSPGAPLERFAPGHFEKTIMLEQFGALENFAGASQRLAETAPGSRRPSLPAAQLSGVRGQIEAFEGNGADTLPLVVRSADGFGELVFVAVDLNQPPLDRWPALPQLLAALLGRSATPSQLPPVESAVALHLGYNDLSGQLRSALDQFPDVRATPFWLIAVLASGYILLLFPLDYWLNRRLKGSAAWPWVSFAAIVLGVSLGAGWLGRQSHGDRLQVNQADVIDFDVQSGLMRGNTWFSLFSPANRELSISLQPLWHGPHAEPNDVQLSWLGLPGNALGGMGDGTHGAGSGGINPGAATADLPRFTRPYRCSPDAAAGNAASIGPVPIAACSSKCFTGEWINDNVRLVEADLRRRPDHQLAGTVRLAAGLSQDPQSAQQAGQQSGAGLRLTDCVLFHDRSAYVIPKFSAADPIDIDLLDPPQTADTYFTHRKIVGQQDQTTPYDRAGTDRSRILQIMMSYRAAGGLQYIGLLNRYQHFLDLSGHLGLDRAILIGYGPPVSELTVDGQPLPADASAEHITIYRLVLPVRTTESNEQAVRLEATGVREALRDPAESPAP
jgi:hypothetical protein